MAKALIVVDVQNDFCPGGSLAVHSGDEVVPIINHLIVEFRNSNGHIVYTSDYHPVDHSSFEDNGGIWPVHCVHGTPGAALHPKLLRFLGPLFLKGSDPEKDAYSGFAGYSLNQMGKEGEPTLQSLEDYLKTNSINEVLIVGLATDYCVKATALDAVKLGFKTAIDSYGCRGVEVNKGDTAKAIDEMIEAGVSIYPKED